MRLKLQVYLIFFYFYRWKKRINLKKSVCIEQQNINFISFKSETIIVRSRKQNKKNKVGILGALSRSDGGWYKRSHRARRRRRRRAREGAVALRAQARGWGSCPLPGRKVLGSGKGKRRAASRRQASEGWGRSAHASRPGRALEIESESGASKGTSGLRPIGAIYNNCWGGCRRGPRRARGAVWWYSQTRFWPNPAVAYQKLRTHSVDGGAFRFFPRRPGLVCACRNAHVELDLFYYHPN